MKKNIFILSDDMNFDKFWLEHKVKIFIESKIINENYSNFFFITEKNDFNKMCIDYLNFLNEKTQTIFITNDGENLCRYDLPNIFNKRELIKNYNEYIKNNADYIIFYVKNDNDFLKLAQKNNIEYINFY